jgi:3-phosphoshikimate 1-carboxyvinyltransferase
MSQMIFSGSYVDGSVTPPASKSHTHRSFVMASLAEGDSAIRHPLVSADTESTINAMKAFGAEFDRDGDTVLVTGGRLHVPSGTIDAGNSGTTMRLVTGVAALFNEMTFVTGDSSLLKRPMSPLLDALSQMGAICNSAGGLPPVTIKGPIRGGHVSIDGTVSSQFISSLMIAAPMLEEPTEIDIVGRPVSRPYLRITANMMARFGATAELSDNLIKIKEDTGYTGRSYSVPADFSSAAFPLVAGALAGKVTVTGMDMDDPQGDKRIVDILKEAGAKVHTVDGEVSCESAELAPADLDIGDVPDLFPALAILFCGARGRTRLYGAPQLKHKESDRIRSVTEMISALGGHATPLDDGCVIDGTGRLAGGSVNDHGDHRIMMAAAIASLISDAPVGVNDPECCAISYPEFPDQMRSLGLKVE